MASDVVRALDLGSAWGRLATGHVGRLGVSIRALPLVVPVNYLVGRDASSLIFALPDDSMLSYAVDGSVYAFETGGIDPDTRRWWSVVARGRATLMVSPEVSADELERLQLPSDAQALVASVQTLVGADVPSARHVSMLAEHLAAASTQPPSASGPGQFGSSPL